MSSCGNLLWSGGSACRITKPSEFFFLNQQLHRLQVSAGYPRGTCRYRSVLLVSPKHALTCPTAKQLTDKPAISLTSQLASVFKVEQSYI